jgi:hypothetical protein
LVDVKVFTFPGAVTPVGTVHVYVYIPVGVAVANSVAVFPSHIVGLVTVGVVGNVFTVAITAVLAAVVHPLFVAST